MSKRSAEHEDGRNGVSLKDGDRPERAAGLGDGEQFEDEFEDEFESDDEVMEAGVDGRPDDEREAEEADAHKMDVDKGTFIPGRHKLSPGEILQPDETAYDLLHELEPTWPCLSFDILRDTLGEGRARKRYPATVYSVAGTMASKGHERENEIMVMKMSKLSRMEKNYDESSDEDESDDDDENTDSVLEKKGIKIDTTTNRIRAHQSPSSDLSQPAQTYTAAMTESGQVLIHDITPHLTSFDTPGTMLTPQQNKPVHTILSHKKAEGFAVDWAPQQSSRIVLTGDNSGAIFKTTQLNDGSWKTDGEPWRGHSGSVEELQWSPTEENVFTSASSDGTVCVWDTRRNNRKKPALRMHINDSDINVLSWSRLTTHLLASGADDGQFAVWDLRQWRGSQKPSHVAAFNFHNEQITSVEWHPTDDSNIAVAAGDNTVTLWDLAVELDDEESKDTAGVQDVPPQLLFVHYLNEAKEVHWHPQIPGLLMATGGSGFNVFKTISV